MMTVTMLLGLSVGVFADTLTPKASAAVQGSSVPAIRYFVMNGGWRYAEAVPLYNSVEETFFLDTADSANVQVPASGAVNSINRGTLSQFIPAGASSALYPASADISVPESGDAKAAVDEKALTFNSSVLYFFYANEITGYPTADLYVSAAKAGTMTVLLEAVQQDGTSLVIAKGEAALAGGEQRVPVNLYRAYSDGKDDKDFVAYQWPARSRGSIRVTVFSSKGTELTVYSGGSKASKVTLPFREDDENGYNGKVTINGNTYNGSMYWLQDKIYLNYTVSKQNDTWASFPADSTYKVVNGAAVFSGFTFLPEGNSFKNAAEQAYTGNAKNTQPFPTFRHVVLDTVGITPVADTLYMPTIKTLKYDIFMPTGGITGKAPPIIFFIHGYSGSYSALPDFLKELLGEGYAVAGIDLRNYPSNFSPDHYHDIKGNIRDVRANAALYGVDPDRFGVFGESLGGNTSLMMMLSGDDQAMEGTVGGNLEVSSRVQAGVIGYGWTDLINFGADQRTDNANNTTLLAGMITGGDGETAPAAQVIDWYGPGKGLLMLRNYLEEREAAEEAGTLSAFLSKNYTLVVDEAYLAKWYPWQVGGGLFAAGATSTIGTYTYTHAELEAAIERAKAASPLYYVTPDDPAVAMFAGYGGTQNITNTQSTRTLQALSDAGVEGFMYANTQGNYGKLPEIKASMKNYLNDYLMEGPKGVKIALKLGSQNAVVNYVSAKTSAVLKKVDGSYMLPLSFVAAQLGADITGVTDKTGGVSLIDGKLYATADYIKSLGATVTVWDSFETVVVYKADAVAPAKKSLVTEPTAVSKYGEYSGYGGEVYPNYVVKSVYVEVPAYYEGASRSEPDYTGNTVKLALDYVLPADADGNVVSGKFPTVMTISRGGRFAENDSNGGGPIALNLVKNGYAYAIVEMRGCGASFGVNNSFTSVENRLDVKYIMENWLANQSWSDGKYATMGGSNRGLIQQAAAAVTPKGLLGITPVVCNADFYYQDYMNGVSAVPSGMNLSGTNVDPVPKSYEDWKAATTTKFVDEDTDGRLAYDAYVNQTLKNKAFTAVLLLPNLLRDQEHSLLYNEKVNLTIPPMEYSEEIIASGTAQHQLAGYYDSNATWQIATSNAWGGTIVIGPWNHGGAIRGASDTVKFDVAADYLRWFDYLLKGVDNGYDETPPFYYYVVGATPGEEWRYSDTFPLDNANNTTLYLATESENVNVAGALKLSGAQSNNGKLTPAKPASASTAYTVDTSVEMPADYHGMNTTTTQNMIDVDSKGLTFTSAPLAAATEIVGIPTIDLWVSCANSNDVDFIAYLEEVKADGTSSYISRALMRASHRKTGENILWDSTEGLAGRFHTSLAADVNAALAEGLSTPVNLKFSFDVVSRKLSSGSSLRVTVTCANTKLNQHYMYYELVDGKYVLKTKDLPEIRLCTGGDKASYISIPVVENVSNTFNGTVTMADGSYTGPGTLYMFDANYYLYYNGSWMKIAADSAKAQYTVKNNAAVFANAGFSFLPEGTRVVKNGIAQNYKGGQSNVQPFPTVRQIYLDTVDIKTVPDLLYLPTTKNLYIDLFSPEASTGSDPLIFFIHGYGGTTVDLPAQLQSIMDEGYAVAGIDLRNYPSNTNPDYYQDIKGSIRFMRANAAKYGVDPNRFGMYGVSLGGNTTLMMLLSGDNEFMEGTVGGNTGVSSRLQAGIAGYAWSDALYFGADQRFDNQNNPTLLASMITGGDGESAPCAQAIDFYGPGKGYLVLRNYLEARTAAEAAGTLGAFLSAPYTFTIDQAYLDKHFANVSGNMFASAAATATKGTYTYSHEYLMQKIEDAKAASPVYYASPDDPTIVVFGGFGGRQNITNQQSVRTLSALQDVGVTAFYYGNTLGNYGEPASIQAGFMEYLDNYLMNRPAGTKLSLTIGSVKTVVNDISGKTATPAKLVDGVPYIPVKYVADILGLDASSVTSGTAGVRSIDGVLYATVDAVKAFTGAAVTWYGDFNMVTIVSGRAAAVPPTPTEPTPHTGHSSAALILTCIAIMAFCALGIVVLKKNPAKR